MATKTRFYRCTNRSKCELGRNRTTIEIGEGKRHECPLKDPNCERANLREIDQPKKGPPKVILASVAAVVLVIVLTVALWPRGTNPGDSASVETALKEVWPWLK